MEFTIRRVCNNSLLITRSGYKPKIISFEELFDIMKSDVDKEGYIESVSFDNSTICMNQVHPYYGMHVKCEVLVDNSLLTDSDFYSKLTEFLEYCDYKKDELYEAAQKKYKEVNFEYKARREAKYIYQDYCATGQIKPIESLELVKRIIELCREKSKDVYTESIDTLDGSRSYIYYNNLKTKILDRLHACSLMASVALGIACVSLSSKMNTIADPSMITGPITMGASYIGTGALSFLSYRISEKEKNTKAFNALDEIANILEDTYLTNKKNKAYTL